MPEPAQPVIQPTPTTVLDPAKPTAKVPAWLLPLVAAMALILGLVGGAFGGVLAVRDSGTVGSGGQATRVQIPPRTTIPLPAENKSVPAVAEKVLPSTIQVVAEYQGKDNGATGSGWVYDNRGHIITNNHVIESAVNDNGPIKIIDNQGNHYSATIVGRSTVYDLAVLKAPEAKNLPPLAVGASQDMRVGETVVAVGSPLGLTASVTSGIVSALERPVSTGNGGDSNSYINAVQTDAAINPGNSGGPLVNLQGQVIGVNSAIASMGGGITGDQGGNIGVGFAIPSEQVVTTAAQIISTGKAEYPVIGAGVKGSESLTGAVITNVEPGMPAARAGLKADDLVRRINGRPITSSIDLVVAIRSHVAGDKVTLTVERGGKTTDIHVTLAAKSG
jgi:putative serine protease PepD